MPFVQPLVAPAPLEGNALLDFVQGWLAGVLTTYLAGNMIRPYAQAVPPVVPNAGEAWMAFTVQTGDADTFPSVKQIDDNTTELQRHERLRVLCSLYDTGINGQAANLARLLRDGTAIPQNLEYLYPDFGLVGVEEEITIPSLLKTRWLWRVDQPIVLTRLVTRDYGQQTIASANGTLKTDVGLPDVPINAEQ